VVGERLAWVGEGREGVGGEFWGWLGVGVGGGGGCIINLMSEGEHSIDDYELLCVIGKGVFGKIFLVREIASEKVYAMKVVKKHLISKQNKLNYIFTERNVLIQVRSGGLSCSTRSSSESWRRSRTRRNSTSSWSTAREASCTTCWRSRRSSRRSRRSSTCRRSCWPSTTCTAATSSTATSSRKTS
jgi:hypothetical protein